MKETDDFKPTPMCLCAIPVMDCGEDTTSRRGYNDYEFNPGYTAIKAEFQVYNPSRHRCRVRYTIILTDAERRPLARKDITARIEQGQRDATLSAVLPFGNTGPKPDSAYTVILTESGYAEESLLEKRMTLIDLHGMRPEEACRIEEAFVTAGHDCAPRRTYAEADGPYEFLHAIFNPRHRGPAPHPQIWAEIRADGVSRLQRMNVTPHEDAVDICPDPSKICASVLLPDPYSLDTESGYTVTFKCLGHTIGSLACEIHPHADSQGKWLRTAERNIHLVKKTF